MKIPIITTGIKYVYFHGPFEVDRQKIGRPIRRMLINRLLCLAYRDESSVVL